MTGNELVEKYHEIWKKYKTTNLNAPTSTSNIPLLDRGFVFQFDAGIRQPDLLFIGINPSFTEEKIEELFYTQEEALQHSYFKPFETIEKELEKRYNRSIVWTHVDMLVFRETKQSFIREHLFKTDEGLRFLMDQLKVSKELIEQIQPRVIVVSNTMAKELLGKNRVKNDEKPDDSIWAGLEFEFNDTIGTDLIVTEGPLKGTPVFFTSMLSGQRALDNGTKERLVWHINEVL